MKKLAGVVLGLVMVFGAVHGLVAKKSGPVSAIPPTCPVEICPNSN